MQRWSPRESAKDWKRDCSASQKNCDLEGPPSLPRSMRQGEEVDFTLPPQESKPPSSRTEREKDGGPRISFFRRVPRSTASPACSPRCDQATLGRESARPTAAA